MDHESSVPRLHSDKSGQYLQFLIREILNCYDQEQNQPFSASTPRFAFFSACTSHRLCDTHVLVDDGRRLPLNRGQDDVQEIVHIGNGRDRLETVDGHGWRVKLWLTSLGCLG